MNENQRTAGAAGGALGLGAFAALFGTCCVAPWTVGVLGVTGAVTLARLSFLQPYFLASAVGLLGIAFWWAYRKPAVCGVDARSVSRRTLRWIVWGAAVLVCCFGVASFAPLALTYLVG